MTKIERNRFKKPQLAVGNQLTILKCGQGFQFSILRVFKSTYCAFHKHANSEKSQLTIAFFAAVNHLNGPLRKQNFTLMGSKGHGL